MAEPAPPASAPPHELRARYHEAFRSWLAHRDERELGAAYALGREAVSAELSVLDLAETHHQAARRGAARGGRPGAPRRAARGRGRVLRRGALDVRDRAPRLPRGAGGGAARARARDAAARACRRLGEDQRDDDHRGGAAAHRRRGAAGARRAPGDDLEQLGRPVRARAQRRVAGGRHRGRGDRRADRGDAAQRRPAARHARGRRPPRARVHAARRGDPRPARPARLGRDRQVAGLHARAPHRPGAAALAASAQLPTVPGLSAAVRFIAAGEGIEVGGDFYDFFRARGSSGRRADRRRLRQGPRGRLGDRARPPHAAGGRRVRGAAERRARAAAPRAARGARRRPLLHGGLLQPRGARRTAPACCSSCGGHPLPLVLRRSGAVEPVGKLGTLLGADVEPALSDVTVELAPGELVVLYTDGVTEVRAGREEIFGHRDLAELLGQLPRPGADASPSASRTRCSTPPAAARATTSRCSSSARAPRDPPTAAPDTLPGAPRPPEATDG